jgi:hypothetical protein
LAFVFVKLYPVFKTHKPTKRGFIMKDLKELLTVDAPAIAVLFDLFLDQPAVENDLGATAAVESVRHIFIQQWSKLEDATTSEQLRAAIHSASGVIVLIEALLHCNAFANDGEEVDCFISALSGVTRDFVRALDLTVYSMEKTSELLSGVMS